MEEAVVRKILAMLHIRFVRIESPSKGYRNSSYPVVLRNGKRLNVILYKREAGIIKRIKRADALAALVGQSGLPTRTAHSDIISLTGQTNATTRYARVYNYLPGQTISWEAYTMRHLKQLGKTHSDLHTAVQHDSGEIFTQAQVIDECLALIQTMQKYFSDRQVVHAQTEKLGVVFNHQKLIYFQKILSGAVVGLHMQPLHMDFVRGNVLFENYAITGVIDFEKAAYGPPVFDIARTMAFLLVDCKYKSAAEIWKHYLQSGYIKYGSRKLTKGELLPLKSLIAFYMLHDYYKFLRHNPYESLHLNEHFLRTRDFLVKDGIIEKCKAL